MLKARDTAPQHWCKSGCWFMSVEKKKLLKRHFIVYVLYLIITVWREILACNCAQWLNMTSRAAFSLLWKSCIMQAPAMATCTVSTKQTFFISLNQTYHWAEQSGPRKYTHLQIQTHTKRGKTHFVILKPCNHLPWEAPPATLMLFESNSPLEKRLEARRERRDFLRRNLDKGGRRTSKVLSVCKQSQIGEQRLLICGNLWSISDPTGLDGRCRRARPPLHTRLMLSV